MTAETPVYQAKPCRGHWHVYVRGEPVGEGYRWHEILGAPMTEGEAVADAARRNAEPSPHSQSTINSNAAERKDAAVRGLRVGRTTETPDVGSATGSSMAADPANSQSIRNPAPVSSSPAAAPPAEPTPGSREVRDYPEAARSIALNLAEFCDESKPSPAMIADAARKAHAALTTAREENAALLARLTPIPCGNVWLDSQSVDERYKLLCDAVNEHYGDCLPSCDSYGHDCDAGESAPMLIRQQAALTTARAERDALREDASDLTSELQEARAARSQAEGERDSAIQRATWSEQERDAWQAIVTEREQGINRALAILAALSDHRDGEQAVADAQPGVGSSHPGSAP